MNRVRPPRSRSGATQGTRLRARPETPPAIAAAARVLARLGRQVDLARMVLGALLAIAGVLLATFGALADVTLHRGVETGIDPPIVLHVSGRGLATNADLTRFAPEQLPEVAEALRASDIRYVRQSFAWSEIEPRAGELIWDRYDAIVNSLNERGIRVIAVLHRSPDWARPPEQVGYFDAPPTNPETYANFANAVAARYGDRLQFYQLWDEPNRADHWGGRPGEPAEYVSSVLSLGFNAIRAANPTATIILAEPARQTENAGLGADLAWVRGVYESGGQPFFHVVAADLRGGVKSPYDRGVAADLINLARATLFRELMIELDDAERPIWGTHYGWARGEGDAGVPESLQADYAVAGMDRARAEWPWLGPLFFSGLAPGPSLGGEVPEAESLLRADGTSTLLLSTLQTFADTGSEEMAATGYLPVSAQQFVYEGNWNLQHLGAETFRTTTEVGARLTVQFVGTGAIARVRLSPESGPVTASLDGEPINLELESFQASNQDVTIARGLSDEPHTLVMELVGPGELTVGGLVIERLVPLQWTSMLLLGGGLLLLFLGLRQVIFTLAERSGRLQRRRGVDLWPEMPHVGDWRPARRA